MKHSEFSLTACVPDLVGRVFLITGGTAGLGRSTIEQLVTRNPERIFFTGRDAAAADSLMAALQPCPLTFIPCDLADLSSVRTAAQIFRRSSTRLDALICSAGIMFTAPGLTKDGYEAQFGVNHMGHALLIHELLPVLQSTAKVHAEASPRILIVASEGYRFAKGLDFDALRTTQDSIGGSFLRYHKSKLANVLYAQELASRFPDITTVSLHPGAALTQWANDMAWYKRWLLYLGAETWLTMDQYPQNVLWLIGASKTELVNGGYYLPVGDIDGKMTKVAKDRNLADQLWEWTQRELAA